MSPAFKLFVAGLLTLTFFVALQAFAGSATVTWTLPTQNTDGTTIAAGTLASTTVSWGSCGTTAGTFGTEASRATVAVPATSYVVPNLAAGTYCFRALVTTTGAVASDWSTVATKVVPAPVPPTPKPPVIVTVATVAYEISMHPIDGPRLGRNVGIVPLGIECTGEPLVGFEYFEIPRSAVKLTKQPKSAILVARCG